MTSTVQDDRGELNGLDDLPGAGDGLPAADPIVALHAYLNLSADRAASLVGPSTSLAERGERLANDEPIAVAMVLAQAPQQLALTIGNRDDDRTFDGLNMVDLARSVQVTTPADGPFGAPQNVPFDVQLDAARNGDEIVYSPADSEFALRISTVTDRSGEPIVPREVGFWIELRPDPSTGPGTSSPIQSLMTVYTRRAVVEIKPTATTQQIEAFEQRLAMFTDPRGWDLSTGPTDQDIQTMEAGWIQSYPTAAGDGPSESDAKAQHVHSRLGTTWNLEAGEQDRPFYELVWPGFNRPWGVMLNVNFQVKHQGGSILDQRSGWDELLVKYRMGKHLHQRGGPLGRRPVGPSLMPVTRDDGHLRVARKVDDAGELVGYDVEMVKELNFQDIVPGRVVDTVEETMPFVAAGWFGALHGRWFQAILDESLTTAEVEQRERDKPYYKPERLRAVR